MRAHLMGVGGAGVSALARVFLARGDEVSGCDLKESETTSELEAGGSSAAAGKTEWLVAETDESDGTLTLHHPQRAIVTNIELDHPDHFRDVSAVRDLFQWFIEGLPQSGLAVLCADDELARELKPKARKSTCGFRQGATYRCEHARPFPIYRGVDLLGHVNLRQPGRHNIQNATAAAA